MVDPHYKPQKACSQAAARVVRPGWWTRSACHRHCTHLDLQHLLYLSHPTCYETGLGEVHVPVVMGHTPGRLYLRLVQSHPPPILCDVDLFVKRLPQEVLFTLVWA